MSLVFIIAGCQSVKIELSFDRPAYDVEVNEQLTLRPNILNENDEEFILVYSSEDNEIATYKDDVVTGVTAGTVLVRVSLKEAEEVFAEVTINVIAAKNYPVIYDTAQLLDDWGDLCFWNKR